VQPAHQRVNGIEQRSWLRATPVLPPGDANGGFVANLSSFGNGVFGVMVALRGAEIVRVPLADATRELKTVPPYRYDETEVLFG
jgi:hypothetical protein